MASHHLLLSLLFLAFAVSTTLGQAGGPFSIPYPGSNQKVQDLGNFAVVEYNKETPSYTPITFIQVLEVLEAQGQVPAGMNYYLKLSAKYPSNDVALFYAIVFEPLELDEGKMLISFFHIE